jgi:hypothetical protein
LNEKREERRRGIDIATKIEKKNVNGQTEERNKKDDKKEK